MKKTFIIIILFAIYGINVWAQQTVSFSNYYFNPLNINPAYAGSRSDLTANIIHRSQWVGINGSPTSESVNISGLVKKFKIGWGAQVFTDAAGPLRNTNFQLAMAYHLKIGSETRLSFGIQGSLNSMRVMWDKINIENTSDQSFSNVNNRSLTPDVNFGMYLYHENYFAGLSATHLLESPFNLDKSGENSAKFYRHFYLTGGMIFKVNDDLDFRPSVMAKYVLASPINIGLMESFIFFKKFTLGAGVQGGKRIAMKGMDLNFMALIEYKINQKFRVGYNYESGVSALGKRNYGSHEIMLGWDMNFKKARKTTAIIVNASNTYDIQN